MKFVLLSLLALLIIGSLAPESFKHAAGTQTAWHRPLHWLCFALLTTLTRRAYPARSTLTTSAGLIGLGILIEFAEHLVYHGSVEWKDVRDDSLGVVLGLLVVAVTSHPTFLSRAFSTTYTMNHPSPPVPHVLLKSDNINGRNQNEV